MMHIRIPRITRSLPLNGTPIGIDESKKEGIANKNHTIKS